MKSIIFFGLSMLLFNLSCTKISDPIVTSFQLVFTDYNSGDTIPNVPFTFRGVSVTNYNFDATTNNYGNFDTLIQHQGDSDFDCHPPSSSIDFVEVSSTGQVNGGTNTAVNISVIQPALLQFNFDCSGLGYIQNVSFSRLTAVPDTCPLPYHQYANGGTPYITCGLSNGFTVFPGDWVVQYQYRLSISSPWGQILDTVSVLPDEYLEYTIVY